MKKMKKNMHNHDKKKAHRRTGWHYILILPDNTMYIGYVSSMMSLYNEIYTLEEGLSIYYYTDPYHSIFDDAEWKDRVKYGEMKSVINMGKVKLFCKRENGKIFWGL